MERLRERRALLVLDNLETLLEEGTGRMRSGYEEYAKLLRRIGETAHQSCLALTSREKPADLAPLEGHRSPPISMISRVPRCSSSRVWRCALGDTETDAPLLLNAGRRARAEGRYRQAAALFAEALAQHRAMGDRGSASSGGRGQSLYDLALLRREQGAFAEAVALLEAGIALHREIGEREGEVIGLLGLGDIARDRGDAVGARTYSEQSLTLSRELGVQRAIGFALNNLALAAYLEGDLRRAFALSGESLTLFRGMKSDASLAEVLITQGRLLRAQGNSAAAYAAVTEALRLALVVGPRLMVAAALEELAGIVVAQDRAELAARLLAAAEALRLQMGTPVRPVDQAVVEATRAAARSALGPQAFEAAWSKAGAQPLEQLLLAIPAAIVPSRGAA
jgi:tetratricopeptide (TPR) repeat protein